MTEWNQWIEAEKQERQKEVAELEQTISGSKEELSDILHQQIVVGRETEQIRKEGEAIRQEVSELSTTNLLLKEQTKTLAEDKEKLLSKNEKLEKQQKQISRLTDKVMEQNNTIERLQEKASDFGRLERHLGREQVQLIVERSKVLEQAEKANKRPKHAFEMN